MAEINGKKHYGAIDGLRGYSAIGIILMHVLANGKYATAGFIFDQMIPSFTNLVFLFMVISGFGMCCGYYSKVVQNDIPLAEFYGKRYQKIWPYFALLCVMDLALSPSKEALYETFANLTLCFGLIPNASISVIGVGWFLGVVFVFYLIFPFFCYLLSDKRRAWLSFGVAIILNILCSVYFTVDRTSFIYCAVFFLAGGLIFLYRDLLAKVAQKYRWVVFLVCAGLVPVYYLTSGAMPVIIALCSSLVIYCLSVQRTGILQNPVTKFLGGISMEMYLCHMVIFRLIEKIGLTHIFQSDVLSYTVTAAGTIAGTIVFSLVASKGLEIAGRGIKRVIGKLNKNRMENSQGDRSV